MKPGETDSDKKTVSFDLYNSSGLPASGLGGEGSVAVFLTNELQISSDYGSSYTTALGTFAHGGDGTYKYVFTDAEVAVGVGEKNLWLRYKETGFRTRVIEVSLRYDTDTVRTLIGTPAGVSVSADIVAVKADTASILSTVGSIQTIVTTLLKIGVGRWKVVANQLILYDTDETTPIYTFDLLDDEQEPTMTKIFERLPA